MKRANRDVTVAGLFYPEGTELPDGHKAVERVPDAFDDVAKKAPAKKAPAKKKAAAKSDG